MKEEVHHAVNFLTNIVENGGVMNAHQLEGFRRGLFDLLLDRYREHWFPAKPTKGSAYRCMRINHKMDPIIASVASSCGFSSSRLFSIFPSELTLWVDPGEVSYRFGEDGSIGILFAQAASEAAHLSNVAYQKTESIQPMGCSDQYRHLQPDNWEPLYSMNAEFVN